MESACGLLQKQVIWSEPQYLVVLSDKVHDQLADQAKGLAAACWHDDEVQEPTCQLPLRQEGSQSLLHSQLVQERMPGVARLPGGVKLGE